MIILAIAFFSTAFFLFSVNKQQEKPETNITPPFNVGEQLIYEVRLVNSTGTYTLCTVNLSVIGITEVNGEECFILKKEFVGYNGSMYSYVTVNNLTLLKTCVKSPLGSLVMLYDHKENKCKMNITTNNNTITQESGIKPDIQDALSMIYYIRSLPLEENYWCTFNFITLSGELSVNILTTLVKISVEEQLQNISIRLGKFTCYEVSLGTGVSSKLYITASNERLPVLIKGLPRDNEYQYWELVKYVPSFKRA